MNFTQGFGGFFTRSVVNSWNLHCYPVSAHEKESSQTLENGDKIILPETALDQLTRQQVDYPMLFQIRSLSNDRRTHVGVFEFTAQEGTCYVPSWIMENLGVGASEIVTIRNLTLPKAKYTKLRPLEMKFLEISNPKAVLETQLRRFSCLTKGDHIRVQYNDAEFHIEVLELKPTDAASIIETDCIVDFEAPEGYNEQEMLRQKNTEAEGKRSCSSGYRCSKRCCKRRIARGVPEYEAWLGCSDACRWLNVEPVGPESSRGGAKEAHEDA